MPTLCEEVMDELEARLRPHSEIIEADRRGASLILIPKVPDSFSISIYEEAGDVMVAADRWHTHFEDRLQAVACVLWLLTPYYRLVQELKSGVLVATWLEQYSPEGWLPSDPVFFLNPENAEDWGTKNGEQYAHRIVQHAVLDSPRPFDQMFPGAELNEVGYPEGTVLGIHMEPVAEPTGPSLF